MSRGSSLAPAPRLLAAAALLGLPLAIAAPFAPEVLSLLGGLLGLLA